MRRLVWLLILPAFLLSARYTPAAFGYGDRILRVADRSVFGLGQILPDLKTASLIFIGEQHDDIRHHEIQLRIIRTLHNLGLPLVIGLETFPALEQDQLDSWVKGGLSEDEFIQAHNRNWGDTWPLYRDLYRYARDRRIPLLGLNVPDEITRKVAREGFASLTPEQRSLIPVVSCDVDRQYMAFIRTALSIHGGGPEDGEFENFCEAQLIWDKTMAFNLAGFLARNPDAMIVVIAGNSHAWRPGIPAQLGNYGDGIDYRIILPEVPPVQTRRDIEPAAADYLWMME